MRRLVAEFARHLGEWLYPSACLICDGRGTAQRSGELPIAQRDPVPGTEDVEQHGQPVRYGDSFRASFGLDR